MVRAILTVLVLGLSGLIAAASSAQAQQAWIQVEAHPNLRTAEARARAYGEAFDNVTGYRLSNGWYALALGPFAAPNQARSRLLELRQGGIIPRDSYIAFAGDYREQFWPIGAGTAAPSAAAPTTEPVTEPVTQAEPEAPPPPLDETPQEARASERLLDREGREALQIALKWFGFYTAGIDGSFGRGTRASMTRWQEANGFDKTGILTTKQRALLLEQYDSALAELGLGPYDDDKAGIALTMPTGLVEFAGYDFPFVRFREKDGSGVQVLLISQAGDDGTLSGLYEIMQTLEVVPLEGERRKRADSFVLRGADEIVQSYTEAKLAGGWIKGFSLIYPPARAAEMEQVIAIMKESFETSEGSLEAVDSNEEGQRIDLMAGLELRQPKLTRSGFYVGPSGAVVTSADVVASCERITIDELYDAEVTTRSDRLALITPTQALAPLSVARFAENLGLLRSTVAVAGYSYGGALSAPTLSFGTLQDLTGLGGDDRVKRLEVTTLEGDIGGPVMDDTGAVAGMLMPTETGNRALPGGTAFALKSTEILTFLRENGTNPRISDTKEALAAEELVQQANDMTVLVSCW